MDSLLKNASKSCIPVSLRNFLQPFMIRLVNFQKNVNSKNLKNLTCWEKKEASFGLRTENYSGHDISQFMNT